MDTRSTPLPVAAARIVQHHPSHRPAGGCWITQRRQTRGERRTGQVAVSDLERAERRAGAPIGAHQTPAIDDSAARIVIDHAVPANPLVARRAGQRNCLDEIRRLLVGRDPAGR